MFSMRSAFDLRKGIGRLIPESADDLWILSGIIRPGALVTARTTRTVEIKRDDVTIRVGRRPVTLTIAVERVELAEKLRISGRIIEAPYGVSKGWHSISVSPGMSLTVKKTWKSWEVNRIRAARLPVEPVLVCILDEREADLWMLRERAEHLVHIAGRGLEKAKSEFYGDILSALRRHAPGAKRIVIAGPGFAKDELRHALAAKAKDLLEMVLLDTVAHTGPPGLQELLRRGTLTKAALRSRIAEETAAVERLLTEIMKEGMVAYGLEQTKSALEAGAVKLLLVSDRKVRELESLLQAAEKTRADIMIISSEHESGQKLLGIGGVAAMLRWKI
jgi:protein pelota